MSDFTPEEAADRHDTQVDAINAMDVMDVDLFEARNRAFLYWTIFLYTR